MAAAAAVVVAAAASGPTPWPQSADSHLDSFVGCEARPRGHDQEATQKEGPVIN